MVIYEYTKENKRKRRDCMLNDEICKLRDKLNRSIEQGEDYSVTYKLSTELDELIVEYYRQLKDKKKKLSIAPV